MSELDDATRRYLARVLGDAGGGTGITASTAGGGVSLAEIASQEAANAEEEDLALSGAEDALAGRTPPARQRLALEAIVLPRLRPAVDIVDDSFATPPAPWEELGEPRIRQILEAAIPSVGRVELPPETGIAYAGTGFVVGDDLLMTNRHVAELFASGLGDRSLTFRPGFTPASVDFGREIPTVGRETRPPEPLRVDEVVMIHPWWDCALLRVDGLPPGRIPLGLFGSEPAEVAERDVAVIGYPQRDRRNDRQLQDQLFRGVYGVKRLLPGRSMGFRDWPSFDHRVRAMTHDSSTLGGNSGSAVIDLETGRVLGLHFAGVYLDANFAVPAWELARDERIVDAGVLFDDPPPFPEPAEWLSAWGPLDAAAPSEEEA